MRITTKTQFFFSGCQRVKHSFPVCFLCACEPTKASVTVDVLAHQRSLQAGSVMVTSAHDQHALLLVKLLRQLVDLVVQRQHFLDKV